MQPIQRYIQNIRFDLIYKALLIVSIGWASFLYSTSIWIEVFLFLLAISTGTLFYFQKKNLGRLLTWISSENQTFDQKIKFLQRETFRSLINTSLSNPILLIVYFFIFSHYTFEGLPYMSIADYFTYLAFALFAFALSFFMGRGLINALRLTFEMKEGLHNEKDLANHKKVVRKKQTMRLVGLLLLLTVLLVLYLIRFS